MNLRGIFWNGRTVAPLALLVFSYPALCDDKKPAPPKAAPPAKSGAKSAGEGASHGSAPGSASKGPTTSNRPTTDHPGATTNRPTTEHPTTTGTRSAETGTHSGAEPKSRSGESANHSEAKGGGASEKGQQDSAKTKTPNNEQKAHAQPIAKNHTVTHTPTGAAVEKRPDGKVASLHDPKRNMDIHHSLSGNRRVEVERPDHSRIVAERGGRGYVQRPYTYNGHAYAERSYYYNGRYYNNYYGNYYYRGVYVNPYYPSYYYAPAYYGWAYNPWVAPVSYGWGWGGNPWYGYYGGYFTPYPAYASASLWLTDYMIANSLQAAYQAQAAQAAALSNPAPLTPETKQLISDEVKQQIALENSEAKNSGAQGSGPDDASSSIQRSLTDGKQHVFVAGHDIDVVDTAGTECALSEGDAIQLTANNAPDAQNVNLSVLASKGGKECQRGDTVAVSLVDLQDMQNHMRETIDQGMKELQAKQGQGGLPAAPTSAQSAPVQSAMAAGAPPAPPEKEVIAQINEQSQEADKAEREANGGAASGPGPNAAPATQVSVDIGQTIAQVEAAMGTPPRQAHVGKKTLYFYTDMKVTFMDGKVSAVD